MSRDRRQHKRSCVLLTTEYSEVSSSDGKIYMGIIADMCESGMCLLTTFPLQRGEKIILTNENSFSNIAVVRWTAIGSIFYKAGLAVVA